MVQVSGNPIHTYIFLFFMFLVALRLVKECDTKYKFELLLVIFYLLTGSLSRILTFGIPGISFFDIRPDRALLLTFGFLLLRRLWITPEKSKDELPMKLPLFKLMLNLMVIAIGVSLIWHINQLGLKEVITTYLKPVNTLLIIYGLSVISSRNTIYGVGKAVVIAAAVSSVISIIQLGINPDFLRSGEARIAFGGFLRSNGIFSTERLNGFFLMTAMSWILIMIKERVTLKYALIALYLVGILCTFHRMTWLITGILLFAYFIFVEKLAYEKMILVGLIGITMIVSVAMIYMEDIKESTVVQERLLDSVDGRKGYYAFALESVKDKPFLGYGSKQNEAYYTGMMLVTGNKERATGAEGGLHSGYISMMFYYGIPSAIFFTAFVILVIFYFGRLSMFNPFFLIPTFMSIFYAIGNITNTNLFSYAAIIYMMHIGLGLGARKQKSFFLYNEASDLFGASRN
jgi:hypothetical protein